MAKNPNKPWTKEKVVSTKPKHTVAGGPLNGYTVLNPDGEVISTHEKMWDAINARNEVESHG